MIDRINQELEAHGVRIVLFSQAYKDIRRYDAHTRKMIYALLLKRAKDGPLLKPDGYGEPLGDRLKGFAKIKPKKLNLRIVYRPVKLGDTVWMEVIAVGPRDRNQIYETAAIRLTSFFEEMNERRKE